MPHRRYPHGFTLIELLVVVAIILALLAILLPSMNRAVEITQRTVCASNQHQISVALLSDAADHFGQLTGAARNSVDAHVHPAQIYETTWRRLVANGGLIPQAMHCPSALALGPNDSLIPALDAYPLGGQIDAVDPPTEGDLFFVPDSHNVAWNLDDRRMISLAILSDMTEMGCTIPANEVPISAKRTVDPGKSHLVGDRNSILASSSVKPYRVNGVSHSRSVGDTVMPEGANRGLLDGSVGWVEPNQMGQDNTPLTPHATNLKQWTGKEWYRRGSCIHVKERFFW